MKKMNNKNNKKNKNNMLKGKQKNLPEFLKKKIIAAKKGKKK
jgi:hypothetical protein